MADSNTAASSSSSSSSYPHLTPDEKKRYANDSSLLIPLTSLAGELHLTDSCCPAASASQSRNCKHNLHCLHGLGYERRGIYDGWSTGVAKRPQWLQLLGQNPHDLLRKSTNNSRVGLQNLGATCYLNTLFQFLFMDPIVRKAVYQFEPPAVRPSLLKSATKKTGDIVAANDAKERKELMMHHLQQVFTHLEHSALSSYNPSHIVNALGLSMHEQQDVHEFLNLLVFQLLEKELNASANPICRAVIPKLFTGQIVHVMEGQSCHHQSERLSEFHDLSSIQIKGQKRLEDCLDEYFREEAMESDREIDRWKCGTCGKRENAIRYTYLKDPPPILILQLGRFEFDFNTLQKKKLNDSIKLPKRIDLTKYIQPPKSATVSSSAPSSSAASSSKSRKGRGAKSQDDPKDATKPKRKSGKRKRADDEDDATMESSPDPDSADESPDPTPLDALHIDEPAATSKPKRGGSRKPRAKNTQETGAAYLRGPEASPDWGVVSDNEMEKKDENVIESSPTPTSTPPTLDVPPTSDTTDTAAAPPPVDSPRNRVDLTDDDAMTDTPPPPHHLEKIHAPDLAEQRLVLNICDGSAVGYHLGPKQQQQATSDESEGKKQQDADDAAMADSPSPMTILPLAQDTPPPVVTTTDAPSTSSPPPPPDATPLERARYFLNLTVPDRRAIYPHMDKFDASCNSTICKLHPEWHRYCSSAGGWVLRKLSLKRELAEVASILESVDKLNDEPSDPSIAAATAATTTPTITAPSSSTTTKRITRSPRVPAPDASTSADAALAAKLQQEENAAQQSNSIRGGGSRRRVATKPKVEQEDDEEGEWKQEPRAKRQRTKAKKEDETAVEATPLPNKSKKQKPATTVENQSKDAAAATEGDASELVTDSTLDPSGTNVYELVAILLHKGPSANRGHYTAEILDQTTGQWFSFDDSKVTTKAKKKVETGADGSDTAAATETAGGEDSKETTVKDETLDSAAMEDVPTLSPDANDEVEIVGTSVTTKPRQRGKPGPKPGSKKTVKKESEEPATITTNDATASTATTTVTGRPRRQSAVKKSIVEEEEAEPEGKKPAGRKAGGRKAYADLDDEEGGDEADYDPDAAVASPSNSKKKKAGGGGKKQTAKSKAAAEKKKAADVSVAAASTAYIAIYRRCNTMQTDWNPFTEEEMQATLDHHNAQMMSDDATTAAAASSSADSTSSAPPSSIISRFLTSSAPPLLLHPVRLENDNVAVDAESYDKRKIELERQIEIRREEIKKVMEAKRPSDFRTVAAALAQMGANRSSNAAPVAVTAPQSESDVLHQDERKIDGSVRRPKRNNGRSPPSSPPDGTVDLSTVQLGHYIPTEWFTAYVTGWVLDKENGTSAGGEANENGGDGEKKEGEEDGKEESKEDETAEESKEETNSTKEENDESMKAEADPQQPSTPTATTSDETEEKSGDSSSSTTKPVLTPLQQYLLSNPSNSEVPWPSDLVDSLTTLKCVHGKLNPQKMLSMKRISCDAWKVLWNANEAWRKEQERKQQQTGNATPMSNSSGVAFTAKIEVKEEMKLNDSAITSTVKSDPSSSLSSSSIPHTHTHTSVCPLPCCSLPSLTDADICQDCSREKLLGATLLADQWSSHKTVFDAYHIWDEAQKKMEEENDDITFNDGYLVSSHWWRKWKTDLERVSKALHLEPIVQKKTKGRTPAALKPSALAALSNKPLPKISTDASATEEIRCEHGSLKPAIGNILIPIPHNVWHSISQLHPNSLPVRLTSVDDDGKPECCKICAENLKSAKEGTKALNAKLKAEKGKMRFINKAGQFEDFPAHNKIPLEGTHHILPTRWVRELFAYFQGNTDVRPAPVDAEVQRLLCEHGRLKYTVYPEEDKSKLPAALPMICEDDASTTATAASSATTATTLPRAKLRSVPTGVLTKCDDAEYAHLKEHGWVGASAQDIQLVVKKSSTNVTGDLSTWACISAITTPRPCDKGCIEARLAEEQNSALDYVNEKLTIHRIKPDEKLEDEIISGTTPTDGRRASQRKRAPTRLRERKPFTIVASSTDDIMNIKLKILQEDGMDVNYQEIIWIKPDNSTMILSNPHATLRSYGVPPNAELRLKLSSTGAQDLYDLQIKGGVEHGFKGTALSSSHTPLTNTAATPAAASATASTAVAKSSPIAPLATPATSPAPISPQLSASSPALTPRQSSPVPSSSTTDVAPMDIDHSHSPTVKPAAEGRPLQSIVSYDMEESKESMAHTSNLHLVVPNRTDADIEQDQEERAIKMEE